MKKNLLLSAMVCFVTNLLAQTYSPFRANDITYFSDDQKSVLLPLKVDSIKKAGADSVFYLYKEVRRKREPNGQCQFTGLGDSWSGDSVIVQAGGNVLFFNKDRKPISVKAKALLNEKWVAYENTEWKAELTLSSWKAETFLGMTDSVKTYTLNIISLTGTDITHVYDGLTIKLSKSHGLVKTINFYVFDNKESVSLEAEAELFSLDLVGLENLQLGQTNFTGKEIYNFEIGDKFHIESGSFSAGNREYYQKEIYTILDKTTLGDSYQYSIRRQSESQTSLERIEYSDAIVTETYSFGKNAALHGQLNEGHHFLKTVYSKEQNKWAKVISEVQLNGTDPDCLREILLAGFCIVPSGYTYYPGLGGPYYKLADYWGWKVCKKELVYYKKGSVEWGAPVVLGVEEENTLQNQVKVAPNPATAEIHFDFGNMQFPVSIRLNDLSGKEMASETASAAYSLDVSALQKGCYFYTVVSADNKTVSGKLLVK